MNKNLSFQKKTINKLPIPHASIFCENKLFSKISNINDLDDLQNISIHPYQTKTVARRSFITKLLDKILRRISLLGLSLVKLQTLDTKLF